MSKRSFLALLIFTLVALAAAIGERMLGPDYSVIVGDREAAVPALAGAINNVDVLVLSGGDATLTFRKSDGHWTIDERDGYPADGARIEKTLFQLSELKLDDPKTRRSDRYHRIGVADPSNGGEGSGVRIEAAAGGETVADIVIGNEADVRSGIPEGGRYVRRTGEEQSWLAAGAIEAGVEIKNWINRQILNIPEGEVERATLTHSNGEVIVVSRDSEGKLRLEGIPAGFKLIADFRRDVIAGFVTELEIDDVAPLDTVETDWSGATRAYYEIRGGLELTLWLAGDEDAGYWLKIGALDGDAADAINDRAGGWAFAVPAWKAGDIKRGMDELVEPASDEATSGG